MALNTTQTAIRFQPGLPKTRPNFVGFVDQKVTQGNLSDGG